MNCWNSLYEIFYGDRSGVQDRWVPVTTASRFLRLRMEKRPPVWREAANMLNKQSQTADKGRCSSLGGGAMGDGLTTPHLKKVGGYEAEHTVPDHGRFIRSLRNWIGKEGEGAWTGLLWLRIGTSGGPL
jgi:hypothetical protein